MSGAVPWYDEVVTGRSTRRPGRWDLPELPGLGVEVNEAVIASHPFQQEILHARNAVMPDGTDRGLVSAMGGRLQGKVAIVTGAGQGIGEAIARAFAARGRVRW